MERLKRIYDGVKYLKENVKDEEVTNFTAETFVDMCLDSDRHMTNEEMLELWNTVPNM